MAHRWLGIIRAGCVGCVGCVIRVGREPEHELAERSLSPPPAAMAVSSAPWDATRGTAL